MPINKSGIRYELYDTPKKDEQGRNILCAKVVSSGTYTQQQLEEYLQRHWAIHPSDARRFMTAFVDALSQLLANGYRVDTLLGSFYPKLKLDAPFTATDKVTANDVAFDGIGFLADKAFNGVISPTRSVRLPTSAARSPSLPATTAASSTCATSAWPSA